jgi:DNA repair exonuclease SbcCD ATPase subunit
LPNKKENLTLLENIKLRKKDLDEKMNKYNQYCFLFDDINSISDELKDCTSNHYLVELSKKVLSLDINDKWDISELNKYKDILKDTQYRKKNIEKVLSEIKIKKEELRNHKYDPKCKFCCDNPFVKSAKKLIDTEKNQSDTLKLLTKEESKLIKSVEDMSSYLQWKESLKTEKKYYLQDSESLNKINSILFDYDKYIKQNVVIEDKNKFINELEQDINELEQKFKSKEKIEKQLLTISIDLEKYIENITELKILQNEYHKINKEIEEHKINIDKIKIEIKKLTELSSKLDNLENKNIENSNKLKDIKDKIELKEKNNKIREKNKLIDEQLEKLNDLIKNFTYDDKQLERKEVETQINIENLKNKVKELNNVKKEYKIFKSEADILSLIVSMSHHNGIPAFLLRKITKEMEDTVNDVLSQYSKMKILIKNDGKETSIRVNNNKNMSESKMLSAKMLCGSEKFLVELAFRVAFQILSGVSKPNFMVCDEGWSCLDEEARLNLKYLLGALLDKNDYILTVSHINDVKSWMAKSISICIDNGVHSITQL